MIITKKIRSLVTAIACCITMTVAAETIDRVVAVVNDDVITQSELNNDIRGMRLQLRASGQPIPSDAELKQNVLKHLIDKKLQLQIATHLNITIDDKELNAVISRIAGQNQMTISQLLERIQTEGMSMKVYKETLREQLLLQKVQQHEIAGKITVSKEEFEHAMHSKKWQDQLVHGQATAATKKAIENQLLQEKFEEAGQEWISKLRGIAYIEIKKDN